jgi:hypothetical protein
VSGEGCEGRWHEYPVWLGWLAEQVLNTVLLRMFGDFHQFRSSPICITIGSGKGVITKSRKKMISDHLAVRGAPTGAGCSNNSTMQIPRILG